MISEESKDLARRAEAYYDRHLRVELEKTNLHDFLAIEPDSELHFLGATMSEAATRARQAIPGKRCFLMRVGHRAAVYIGGSSFLSLTRMPRGDSLGGGPNDPGAGESDVDQPLFVTK